MTASPRTSWECAGCPDCDPDPGWGWCDDEGGEDGREGDSVLGGVVPSGGSDPGSVECDLEE